VAVGIGGYALWRHLNPPPGSELSHVHLNISPEASNNAATDKGHILLAQPRAKLPKSTNDLKFHGFTLEKKRGSDLMTAVGDIQNVSENVHLRIQVDLDLLDKTGAKIGTVSDYCTELAANQSWHFLAAVTDPNAMSVRFARLKEDP
ncbi:MAG: hypothetical protein JWQ04_818, partial [Pedosphaera sp.]|nr:hypothetical protein [Pedosphaera sp.]